MLSAGLLNYSSLWVGMHESKMLQTTWFTSFFKPKTMTKNWTSVMSVCFMVNVPYLVVPFGKVQAMYKVENKNILSYINYYAHCIVTWP